MLLYTMQYRQDTLTLLLCNRHCATTYITYARPDTLLLYFLAVRMQTLLPSSKSNVKNVKI
jgi:hypothetical protein